MPIDIITFENNTKENKKKKISELENQINELELNFKNILNKYGLNIDLLLEKQKKVFIIISIQFFFFGAE